MRRFQTNLVEQDARGAAVAIGNFDGVHLGHQAVIDVARTAAARSGAPLGLLTFEPHPRSFFAKKNGSDLPPFRLMNAEARAHRLEKLGVELLLELPFDQALCDLSDWDFCKEILSDGFGLTHVVVGADFCFGKGRSGTAQTLIEHGQRLGFDVTIADLKNHEAEIISSTNIRKALAAADPQRAAAMLGHWLQPPAFGVYAVLVDVLTGQHKGSFHGAASIGVRPMFGENRPNCETFIFDFKGDLYGETLSVGLVAYLRSEQTFDGLEALIEQMDADCSQARRILSAL